MLSRYALLVLVTGLVPSMADCGQRDNSICRSRESCHCCDMHTLSLSAGWEENYMIHGLSCFLMLTNRPFVLLNAAASADLIGTWVVLQTTDWYWED